MLQRYCILFALLVGAPGLVKAEDHRSKELAQKLVREFRELESNALGMAPRKSDQLRILKELSGINLQQAVRFLVRTARDDRYGALRGELLVLISHIERDELLISNLMREHMDRSDPNRGIARLYLYRIATRDRKDDWLVSLFSMGTTEDRFLALKGMGEIASGATLDTAWSLAEDKRWEPDGSLISCGTIIASVKDVEGPRAARLLLLLRKDPRFTEADADILRETTRLWRESDLRKYVNVSELAARDPMRRIDTASFLGMAGLDAARAPLLHLLRNRDEPAEVRTAAADALGGLNIAKGDLAATLARYLRDPAPLVRHGAIRGLAQLKVRQAAAALVGELKGALAPQARAALGGMTGLPADTDWHDWLHSPRCNLPQGT